MFISYLLINVGSNPDRPRPGRLWLRNLYHVHQRLCMAFPTPSRLTNDRGFLKPYEPEDFGGAHVHVERAEDTGFLFRVDALAGGKVMIVVQSAIKPNWEYAFHNADYLLEAPAAVCPYNPSFTVGQRLRFRLVANPTRRDSITKRRVPVSDLCKWLILRADEKGFSLIDNSIVIKPGFVAFNKTKDRDCHIRLRSVRYEGILEVTDAVQFHKTLARGVGPGKSFGFGLLSVIPLQSGQSAEAV
ncbi:MAG: type I-E CRISPR-associated protein Cas6/Cse3/CasE [Candidatus Magnetominusculus sp. LBB02]|nr:type I-E CRISPR-associated protein Cas6/Cse3/CasE [Candidatus Magnetominusculus sp. LBB02]